MSVTTEARAAQIYASVALLAIVHSVYIPNDQTGADVFNHWVVALSTIPDEYVDYCFGLFEHSKSMPKPGDVMQAWRGSSKYQEYVRSQAPLESFEPHVDTDPFVPSGYIRDWCAVYLGCPQPKKMLAFAELARRWGRGIEAEDWTARHKLSEINRANMEEEQAKRKVREALAAEKKSDPREGLSQHAREVLKQYGWETIGQHDEIKF